jgi:putative polymerase
MAVASVTHDHLAGQSVAQAALRFLAVSSVMGGLVFNFLLCFVNTRVMGIRDSHVMLMELMIIGIGFLVAADRRAGFYLILGIFTTYMLFLFTLRGQNDLKALRDILIPIVFFAMGSRIADIRLADKLALWSAVIVLVFACFEYFFLKVYLEWFNVLGYYISRGTVSLADSYGATKGLFISGNRPEPRSILPFLGQHRVSSVFLEPVSMGNFGALIFAWALFRRGWNGRWFLFVAAIAMTVFADARFGLLTCVLMAVLSPFFRIIPRTVWLVAPLLILASIGAYGLLTGTHGGDNSFGGRIESTAHILSGLPFGVVLGTEMSDSFTADSGMAYTLTKFGLFGFPALWALFVYQPLRTARAWEFHSIMILYLVLIMVISNSFYSIKTASLMWFMTGTVAAANLPRLKSFWDRLAPVPASGPQRASSASQRVPSAEKSRSAGIRP